jgi:hypothetical protein
VNVCLWVKKIEIAEKAKLLFGFGFDDSGLLGGAEGVRSTSGRLLICNRDIRQEIMCNLSLTHIGGEGNVPTIDSDDHLPTTPFLLTDDLTLHCVFSGRVKLKDARPHSSDLVCGDGIALRAPNWIGFGFAEGSETHLVAFATDIATEIIDETIYSPAWESSPKKSLKNPILLTTK